MFKKRLENSKIEEYAVILDFLPLGDPSKNLREPTAYAIGEYYFTLLLLTLKQGTKVEYLEEVYIGSSKREKVKSIIKRLKYEELTLLAKENLENAIMKILEKYESKFVEFFNKAGPINVRLHSLELIPGIGKAVLDRILEEREREPFKSYNDIENRVKGLKNIKKILAQRIIKEISGEEKIKLFTA
ncbi:DUF655 domain-containing protein [Nanoarchaeota archaeon NZ13-N]|uniref:DUF655 domain-containing protein n=1 Tax=Candidatus Nanoclepta minutus TaxID=1940235 RepID=A0A397WN89_9ARCH|nr:MAG: DUF655 domain-containing protein [Nanoarchaeota archaeon NZ13-N]RIB35535.1 MAG: hypothetical protein BXU00_00285 [Candidatus Nanoclepta minutus]